MLGGMNGAVRSAYSRAGMLFELHLDLLYQCDLDCAHCYLDDKGKKVLPTAFWTDVIDQAAELQVFTLLLSGGEIFLRKDLLEIIAHARRRGIFVHLKSHGGHIDAAAARALADLGVSSVWLSYYATEAAVHDAITRRPGSHAATRAALVHLRAADVAVIAAVSVMQQNRDHWRDVVRECEALGVFVRLNGELHAAQSGAQFPRDIALALADQVAVEDARLERQGSCEVPAASNDWGAEKNCAAGQLALYVSPEGVVTPCVTWPEPLGDLRRGDRLADLWRASPRLSEMRALRKADRAICATCAVREDCDFCVGQAWTAHGDANQPVEALCLSTRARTLAKAARLGLPEPPMPAGLVAGSTRPRFTILGPAEAAALGR